jgi:hypothetical protein
MMKLPKGNFMMVSSTVAAALICFTISLRVSTERSSVERLQRQVVADTRDVRALEAELSTRARKPVLQRWNDNVLGLGAPLPKQFATDAYELAAYAPGVAVPEVPTQTAAPVVQQAVARDDSPIAPVAQQRPGFQTVAYTVSSVETVPVAVPPAAKPEPKRPAVRAAKSADPLAGLLDGINTAPADARKAVTK